MSDSKENEEAGEGVLLAVEENQQLVDAQVEVQPEKVQPEVASAPVTPEETSNHVENGKSEAVSEDIPKDGASAAEPPVEDKNLKNEAISEGVAQEVVNNALHSVPVGADAQILNTTECEEASDAKMAAGEFPQSNTGGENDDNVHQSSVRDAKDDNVHQSSVSDANDDKVPRNSVGGANDDKVHQNSVVDAEIVVETKPEVCEVADGKTCDNGEPMPSSHKEPTTPQPAHVETKPEIKNLTEVENKTDKKQAAEPADNGNSNSKNMFFLDADHSYDGNESGTDEEQSAFMKELENFFRERSMEFKPPKFYGEGLNCLKLWRAVTRLGGYDKVTSCKLWRQVGESFKPPK